MPRTPYVRRRGAALRVTFPLSASHTASSVYVRVTRARRNGVVDWRQQETIVRDDLTKRRRDAQSIQAGATRQRGTTQDRPCRIPINSHWFVCHEKFLVHGSRHKEEGRIDLFPQDVARTAARESRSRTVVTTSTAQRRVRGRLLRWALRGGRVGVVLGRVLDVLWVPLRARGCAARVWREGRRRLTAGAVPLADRRAVVGGCVSVRTCICS